MKRAFAILMITVLFAGCSRENEAIEKVIDLRERILSSNGTSFSAVITADYEDALYTFQLDCTCDTEGNLSFTVKEPASICDITGTVSKDRQMLTFDDKVLAFPPLADGQLSPVMAPYIFLSSLKGGYISACSEEGEGYCIYLDDSFQENQLHLQIFTDAECIPVRAEITYCNLRILTIDVSNFMVL